MIEIEKKFLLTDEQQARLLDGATAGGQKNVTDAYFDDASYRLTLNDFWLRDRDGEFELKAPLTSGSGSYSGTNRYNEITDPTEIARVLNLADGPDLADTLAQAGITAFVTCYTQRTSYEKQAFHIDIDAATYKDSDFTYDVAEIELLVEDESQADEADERIVEFAKAHQLTTDQIVLGKIAAFLVEANPDHYQQLVAAGVLK